MLTLASACARLSALASSSEPCSLACSQSDSSHSPTGEGYLSEYSEITSDHSFLENHEMGRLDPSHLAFKPEQNCKMSLLP